MRIRYRIRSWGWGWGWGRWKEKTLTFIPSYYSSFRSTVGYIKVTNDIHKVLKTQRKYKIFLYNWKFSRLQILRLVNWSYTFISLLILFTRERVDRQRVNIKCIFHRFLWYHWKMFLTRKWSTILNYTRIGHEIEQSEVATRRDADDRLWAVSYDSI